MYDIAIANSQQSVDVDEDFLRDVVEKTLSFEQVAAANVSVALVDNATIRALNRQHLDHDYDTDVLSFLLECDPTRVSGSDAPSSRSPSLGAASAGYASIQRFAHPRFPAVFVSSRMLGFSLP